MPSEEEATATRRWSCGEDVVLLEEEPPASFDRHVLVLEGVMSAKVSLAVEAGDTGACGRGWSCCCWGLPLSDDRDSAGIEPTVSLVVAASMVGNLVSSSFEAAIATGEGVSVSALLSFAAESAAAAAAAEDFCLAAKLRTI